MDNFHDQYQKTIKIIAITIGLAILLWVFLLTDKMAGLVFGLSLGMVNTYLLYRNVTATTDHIESEDDINLRPRLNISSWRLFFVIIGLLLAFRLEGINLMTTIFGFFYCQILVYIYFLIDALKNKDS